MTENTSKNGHQKEKRRMLVQQLRQLAAKMESKEPNKSADWVGKDTQIRLTQYQTMAGKIIVEAYQTGESSNGALCQILDPWSKTPSIESTDWNYIQALESICWQWYGNRFEGLRQELGELCAYAHVIRLVIGEFERQDLD